MMTEQVDQSFQGYPLDSEGMYGGRLPLPHEAREVEAKRRAEEDLAEQQRMIND